LKGREHALEQAERDLIERDCVRATMFQRFALWLRNAPGMNPQRVDEFLAGET
jgi:hypothetical protein